MHATTLGSAEWSPVSEPQRAISLDVLRGFALFGVLVANTLQFAYPVVSAPSDLEVWRGTSVADRATVFLVGLLVEGKFSSHQACYRLAIGSGDEEKTHHKD